MADPQGRANFFEANPRARAWAALDEATNQQRRITPGAIRLQPGQFAGKRAVILGSGVAGLTTAYELLAQEPDIKVTVFEAQHRTGGRCLSLRTGDTFTEDEDFKLTDSTPGETQVVRFKRPVGDSEPYLNAGPGRIPSSHKRLLAYLKKFGVEVEVYVMNTEANLVQMEDGPRGSEPVAYRRLDHNVRGWLAQMVYQNAAELLASCDGGEVSSDDVPERAEQLKRLMVSFGELTKNGKYVPDSGEPGFENARSRAGFDVLPGVDAGVIADALSLDSLLDSRFWEKTRFYQPSDFLWQSSLFQPVGGMDRVQHAFAQEVAALGGTIHLNSPVTSIDWDFETSEFVIQVSKIGTAKTIEYRADYCFSNIAMPFLENILSDRLQSDGGFAPEFRAGLQAVYTAQDKPKPDKDGYKARFLADTTKVGWQADRFLWQGRPLTTAAHKDTKAVASCVPDSEVGVVPIFGGISWTDHEIVQIWYPSDAYHDEKGILTGAYNFGQTAQRWGEMKIDARLEAARTGAKRFGKAFGDGLGEGVAIAWQNMPYIKGGWAYWQVVEDAVSHFNTLAQGTGVAASHDASVAPTFFVIGDQLSSLPGWQEGAIASALNALSRMTRPDLEIPYLRTLPDTRLMVEGV